MNAATSDEIWTAAFMAQLGLKVGDKLRNIKTKAVGLFSRLHARSRCPDMIFVRELDEHENPREEERLWMGDWERFVEPLAYDGQPLRPHPKRLNEENVREMRKLAAEGVSIAALSEKFAITEFTIRKVVEREYWDWLK